MSITPGVPPTLPVTRVDATRVLRECGVAEGDTILVHSALRPFGEVDGGASAIAAALLDSVGATGTVVAPAFTFRHEATDDPLIDPATDPSEMGAISEALRQHPGALRSTAYRHSVSAIGAHAATITDTDPALSVFDMLSTFGRLLALDARVVLLGLTYVSCTSFHFGEYLVQIPDRHTVDRVVRLRRADGEVVRTTMRDYQPRPTDDGREYEHEHDFDRGGLLLEQAGLVGIGAIGNAVVRVFRLRDLIHLLLDRYGLTPDIFYCDPAAGLTTLPDGVAVSTGDLLDGAGRLVETFWSVLDPARMHS
jgi:aminoglycoside 3-N-acetyltransferase